MHPILFKIGPLPIYTYGFFVFLGLVAAYFIAGIYARREGISKDSFSNIVFWTVVAGFVGAKLLYILIEWNFFLKNPLSVIRSGFVFYGAVIFGFLSLLYLTKKHKISFFKFADILTLGLPLGHAFGRVGCFFYGCCYGKACNSGLCLLFRLDSPAGFSGEKVVPIQLISSFFLILIFFLLLLIWRTRKFDGQILAYYFIFYGFFRFIIEFFRGDERGYILFLSTSQSISVILAIAGIFMLYRLKSHS